MIKTSANPNPAPSDESSDYYPPEADRGELTEKLVQDRGCFDMGVIPPGRAAHASTSAVCGCCSVGCLLNIHLRDGEVVNLSPDQDYPVNRGMACPKGWEALTTLQSERRARVPMSRSSRNSLLQEIDWPTAAHTFCERFSGIIESHGPESVAFLTTGHICTEEMALLGAFAKFGMGLIHGDGIARQGTATAASAYQESFGFDAPPFAFADFEESDVIVLIGSNLCVTHPILWQRVLKNQRSPEILVIDPRRTETAMQATRHLALQPNSDLIFFYGLAHLLIRDECIRQEFIDAHTIGFDSFRAHLAEFTPIEVAEVTGIDETELEMMAMLVGNSEKRVSFWWDGGVNQGNEATRTAQAIINLALMTGNIGRPGTGANSLTGLGNSMGAQLFSNTTNLLGGHDFSNPVDREKVARILGIDPDSIPDRRGWDCDQILDGIEAGTIKGLWVIATNTAHSWIKQTRIQKLLGKLEFLAVQDHHVSPETAQRADLLLPTAVWGEKDGTFINSERRIGLVKRVVRAPGQALTDFSIFRLLAEFWGCGDQFARWESPEAAFGLLRDLSRDQPCDISGIADYRAIDDAGGIQWPCTVPSEALETERRLFEDGEFFTPDGRARFSFDAIGLQRR